MPMLPSASSIIYLVLMLPSASSSLPNPDHLHCCRWRRAILRQDLFGLSTRKVCHATSVATCPVGSYPTFSPFPSANESRWVVCFLWHYLYLTFVRLFLLGSTVLCVARTFLSEINRSDKAACRCKGKNVWRLFELVNVWPSQLHLVLISQVGHLLHHFFDCFFRKIVYGSNCFYLQVVLINHKTAIVEKCGLL